MSLGSSVGWLDDSPVQIMASYLGSKGIHVVASVGNERNEGLFAADQPAASRIGTGVGGVYVLIFRSFVEVALTESTVQRPDIPRRLLRIPHQA